MAITEYAWPNGDDYVRPGGAGANDGTSWADAWDITQVAIRLIAGRRFNFAGDFTLGADLSWGVAGTVTDPVGFRGWNATMSAETAGFDDIPKIDGAGSYKIIPGNYDNFRGLRVTNGTGGILSSSVDYVGVDFCELDNHSGSGVQLDNYSTVSRCRIHDNATSGIDNDLDCAVLFCEIYDNAGDGISRGGNGLFAYGNFIARNLRGIDGSNLHGTNILFNTFDANDSAIALLGGAYNTIMGNQLTNHTDAVLGDALRAVTGNNNVSYNNFYGNRLDDFASEAFNIEGNTYVDPQYKSPGPANNIYEIENSDLFNVPVGLLGNLTIGAWQADAGGAAGGAGYPRGRFGYR